jgi:hypothetical protein
MPRAASERTHRASSRGGSCVGGGSLSSSPSLEVCPLTAVLHPCGLPESRMTDDRRKVAHGHWRQGLHDRDVAGRRGHVGESGEGEVIAGQMVSGSCGAQPWRGGSHRDAGRWSTVRSPPGYAGDGHRTGTRIDPAGVEQMWSTASPQAGRKSPEARRTAPARAANSLFPPVSASR